MNDTCAFISYFTHVILSTSSTFRRVTVDCFIIIKGIRFITSLIGTWRGYHLVHGRSQYNFSHLFKNIISFTYIHIKYVGNLRIENEIILSDNLMLFKRMKLHIISFCFKTSNIFYTPLCRRPKRCENSSR